jgi:hypothetical protein
MNTTTNFQSLLANNGTTNSILRSLVVLNNSQKKNKIMMNFMIAAFTISYINSANFGEEGFHQLPHLPDTLDEALKNWSGGADKLSAEDISFLQDNYGGPNSKKRIFSTLQAVTLLSPILLLLSMQLHRKAWSRQDMILVCFSSCQSV